MVFSAGDSPDVLDQVKFGPFGVSELARTHEDMRGEAKGRMGDGIARIGVYCPKQHTGLHRRSDGRAMRYFGNGNRTAQVR